MNNFELEPTLVFGGSEVELCAPKIELWYRGENGLVSITMHVRCVYFIEQLCKPRCSLNECATELIILNFEPRLILAVSKLSLTLSSTTQPMSECGTRHSH